jgi:hypothetical protein
MNIDWSKVIKGTKVRYKDKLFNETRYGYFAGVFDPTESIKVSKIDRDFEFSGLKMDSYGVCDYIKIKDIELFE